MTKPQLLLAVIQNTPDKAGNNFRLIRMYSVRGLFLAILARIIRRKTPVEPQREIAPGMSINVTVVVDAEELNHWVHSSEHPYPEFRRMRLMTMVPPAAHLLRDSMPEDAAV